jgi:hypothetical protein
MAQNPFYVDPGNDYSSGLSGLSNTMSNIRQAKMQEAQQQMQQKQMQMKQDQYDRAQQRFQEVQSAAQEAFASQDPDKVAQIAIKYPEVTQMLQQATGLKEDMQKKEMSGFLRELNSAPPDQRDAIYQRRIQSVTDRGGDPSHSIQSYEDYKANPEGEIRNTRMLLAGADPVAYNALVNDEKAAQKQQNADRTYGLEGQKMDQQMTIARMNSNDRALGRQISLLNAQQASTTNDLKRQELGLKIDEKIKARQDNNANAYSKANSAAATFDDTLANIDQIQSAPGLSGNFGKSSYIPNVRGSDSANAQALIDTLKGKAFLAAFDSLKGGGQITEVEGTKATNAMLNMENAQSEEQFRKNLKIFQGVINRGKEAAIQQRNKYSAYAPKTDQQGASTGAPSAPASSGGWEIVN